MQNEHYGNSSSTKIIAIVVAAVAVIFIIMALFMYFEANNPYYGYNGYYGGMMGGFGGWGFLFAMPIGLIVLLVIGYAIWRGFGWGGCGSGHYGSYNERENAMSILRQRYARGEISKEQFEQMKKDILT